MNLILVTKRAKITKNRNDEIEMCIAMRLRNIAENKKGHKEYVPFLREVSGVSGIKKILRQQLFTFLDFIPS